MNKPMVVIAPPPQERPASRVVPQSIHGYYVHRLWTPPDDGVTRPPRASWWLANSGGKFRIYVSCHDCANIIVLDPYYVVHPHGYMKPCLKCSRCSAESYRFLKGWKPIKIFTGSLDWRDWKKGIVSKAERDVRVY